MPRRYTMNLWPSTATRQVCIAALLAGPAGLFGVAGVVGAVGVGGGGGGGGGGEAIVKFPSCAFALYANSTPQIAESDTSTGKMNPGLSATVTENANVSPTPSGGATDWSGAATVQW